MGLSINTPKGQETLKYEQRAYELYKNKYPDVEFIETDKKSTARIDAMLVRNGELIGVVEQKSRNLTDVELQKFGTWLITYKKIRIGRDFARQLNLPYFGFLYLIPEDKLLIWQIADADGEWSFDFETRRQWTQKNINGGSANRENAYLPITEVREIIEGGNSA